MVLIPILTELILANLDSEYFDSDSIIANKYPWLRETALEAFMKGGHIGRFYAAVKEFNINLDLEEEEFLLRTFLYKEPTIFRLSSSHRPTLHAAKLFGFIKDNDPGIKERFPDQLNVFRLPPSTLYSISNDVRGALP